LLLLLPLSLRMLLLMLLLLLLLLSLLLLYQCCCSLTTRVRACSQYDASELDWNKAIMIALNTTPQAIASALMGRGNMSPRLLASVAAASVYHCGPPHVHRRFALKDFAAVTVRDGKNSLAWKMKGQTELQLGLLDDAKRPLLSALSCPFLPSLSRHVTSRHVTSRHVTSRHVMFGRSRACAYCCAGRAVL
jgi:hypothetical protein